jgi:NAD(P)-dependent dehydrogenase (short-subunit alcohol dehydrogenase family)
VRIAGIAAAKRVEETMNRVEDKRIVVTGGANGLGAEYARALHAEGAAVAILDRDRNAGAAMAEELGERSIFVEADVADQPSIQRAFGAVADRFGGLDVLVNNAGIYPHKHFEDIELEDWRHVITTNLESVFICTKEAVKYMKAAGGGKIVNVATNLVWIMGPHMAHYIASKAGVVGFSTGVARELAAYGITVNVLAPGANLPGEQLDARGMERMREIVSYQAIKRPQLACDLTGPVIFLCSHDSDFMTGQVMCVDGGVAVH